MIISQKKQNNSEQYNKNLNKIMPNYKPKNVKIYINPNPHFIVYIFILIINYIEENKLLMEQLDVCMRALAQVDLAEMKDSIQKKEKQENQLKLENSKLQEEVK